MKCNLYYAGIDNADGFNASSMLVIYCQKL